MSRDITDNPGGWTRSLPGHTVEYESGFALPFYEGASLTINAGNQGTYTLTISNTDFIYFIDMISVTPLAYTAFTVVSSINDVPYVSACGNGWVNIPLRQNPSIQLIDGDHIDILVTNLDASQRTFNVKINGTKIARPANFGHAPGASYTASPVNSDPITAVVFSDASTHTPTSWEWDFKDGSPNSALQNPSHVYTVAGVYSPKLKAINAYGWDTYSYPSYIEAHEHCYLLNYSEVDAGNKITVDHWTVINIAIACNVDAYLYKDYGAGYFNSYTFRFMFELNVMNNLVAFGVFSLANEVSSIGLDATGCISAYLFQSGGVNCLVLEYTKSGQKAVDLIQNLVADSRPYYAQISHTYGSSTVTLSVYSDDTFTTLVGSVTINHADISTQSFRYIYASRSYNNAVAATISCLTNNIVPVSVS